MRAEGDLHYCGRVDQGGSTAAMHATKQRQGLTGALEYHDRAFGTPLVFRASEDSSDGGELIHARNQYDQRLQLASRNVRAFRRRHVGSDAGLR